MKKGLYRATIIAVAGVIWIALMTAVPPLSRGADAPPVLKQLDEAFVQVAEKVTPAVVNITSSKKASSGTGEADLDQFFKNHPFRDFFGMNFFGNLRRTANLTEAFGPKAWVRGSS